MLYRDELFNGAQTRIWLLALAVGAVLVLFSQTRTSPVRSTWNGGAHQNAQTGIQAQAQPLAGQAQALPQSNSRPRAFASLDIPYGSPLLSPRAVMTQGYGVGSHAPAATWGAVDLAIDSNGDGRADPRGSAGAPIYATMHGTITLSPNSVPAGNHIWVTGEHFKSGYSHLQSFAPGLHDGQVVEPGTLIGYIGSTGESSGPHLDYQIWKDGVNVNPLEYNVLAN